MSTSVRTKAPKKQPSLSNPELSSGDRQFEQSLSALENACVSVLEMPVARGRKDTQRLYWQQRFINITNPVSLALMEYKGPRHFHYHYRHRAHDESILHPVLENPIDMLAQVCKDALRQCRDELVGIDDNDMIEQRYSLENSLIEFLESYGEYSKKLGAVVD